MPYGLFGLVETVCQSVTSYIPIRLSVNRPLATSCSLMMDRCNNSVSSLITQEFLTGHPSIIISPVAEISLQRMDAASDPENPNIHIRPYWYSISVPDGATSFNRDVIVSVTS